MSKLDEMRDIIDVDLYLSSGKKILKYLNNYNIAFKLDIDSAYVEKVIIPEGITQIADSAFSSFTNLEDVELPNSLEIIGKKAFRGCYSIKELIIPDNVYEIRDMAFHEMFELRNIKLPKNLNVIANNLLSSSAIRKITIPSEVELIEEEAFYDNRDLMEIEFEGELPEIRPWSFEESDMLYKIKYMGKYYGTIMDIYDELGEKKMLRTKVYNYPDDCFKNVFRTDVEIINVTPGTKMIEQFAFAGFVNAKVINIPSSVVEIENYAFVSCLSLENITLPKKLKELKPFSFVSCDSLKEIEIPESVYFIGFMTFGGCKSLTKLKLNEGLKAFFFSAIIDCHNLKELSIPRSAERIVNHDYMPDILYGYENLHKAITKLKTYEIIEIGENYYKFIKK